MKKLLTAAMTFALAVGITTSQAHATQVKDMDLDISGIAQIGYMWSEANGSDDQFDINRARLRVKANPAENVHFFSQFELTNNISNTAAGNNTPANAVLADGAADSRLVDMYVTLTYLDWVTVLVGQMPTPVSYELNIDEYELETIDYSQFVGLANRDRGVGLIFPIHNEVQFITWVLNGMGAITGATNDIDDRNNYGAMINWQPMDRFSMKAWGNFGEYKELGVFGAGATQAGERDIDAYGFGFNWADRGFHLMGEYGYAKVVDDNLTTNANIDTNKTRTWNILASYKIPNTNFQLVARYDDYDPDKDRETLAADTDTAITTLGFNWDFEQNARIQVMHEMVNGSNNDNTEIQLSVRF